MIPNACGTPRSTSGVGARIVSENRTLDDLADCERSGPLALGWEQYGRRIAVVFNVKSKT